MKRVLLALAVLLGTAAFGADETTPPAAPSPETITTTSESTAAATNAAQPPAKFFVIPVRDQIAQPALYVIRNGVKDAITAGAKFVVLDMNTPGGDLASTLEIMEVLDRFRETEGGTVVTYVNREAGSAGAIIAAITDRIYFAPKSVMGAAEPILSTGADASEGLKRKITSYLAAKVRALSEGHAFRGQVLQAMMDPTFEFKIGDAIIKAKDGPLLTVTASEAMKEYGDPGQPLLGAGIVEDLPQLFAQLAGGATFEVREFHMTWSIKLARWLTAISPLLLGIGGLLLFIEFKTPGFGAFGILGIALLLVVFLGHNVAGLSGHEAILVFLLGVALVLVELLFFPGVVVVAVIGLVLMFGSLLWGMADIWPGDAFELTPEMFVLPAFNLSVGVILAVVMAALIVRFLPKSVFWNRMVLAAEVSGSATRGVASDIAAAGEIAPGAIARVVSDLHPSGRIEIDGRILEARVEVGEVRAGTQVRVVGRGDFVLIVEPIES